MKKIDLDYLKKEDINSYEQEAKILSKLNNDYIVKYYYSFKDEEFFYIIMEYGGESNLRNFIEKQKNLELIEENIIIDIIKQICLGIKEIHKNKIIHRDLKPENIFIDENNKIKIGDFGISKIISNNKTSQKTQKEAGTIKYMAPEISNKKIYSNKSDIYALGCIMYELFTLNVYEDDKKDKEKVCKIDESSYDKKWQNLLNLLLKEDYHKRLDIEEILNNYLN